LYLVFFAAVAAIGFVLCFLLVRRRKQEFAVMRLLGETVIQITGKALMEQAMLCVIGIMLGVTAVLVSGLGEFSALTCGGVLLCYSIGSALAVMLMVRVNVMEILREKE
jgi:ABC-type antimicrobial peptide transport system permease subunit